MQVLGVAFRRTVLAVLAVAFVLATSETAFAWEESVRCIAVPEGSKVAIKSDRAAAKEKESTGMGPIECVSVCDFPLNVQGHQALPESVYRLLIEGHPKARDCVHFATWAKNARCQIVAMIDRPRLGSFLADGENVSPNSRPDRQIIGRRLAAIC